MPAGQQFAESLGYPPELLANLPAGAVQTIFGEAQFLRAQRNARTKNPHVLAADVYARR